MKKGSRILTLAAFIAAAAISFFTAGDLFAKDAKKAVFDLSHSEIFQPSEFSSFTEVLKKSGREISYNKEPITKKSLEKAGIYVMAGPSQAVGPDEILALQGFVNKGGSLLVMMHLSSPVARLTESFGIIVSNFVVGEESDLIKGQAQDFYVTRFDDKHPVTHELKKIALYGTWGLMPKSPNARVVAGTSEKAWADKNRNRAHDKDEPVLPFGVIGVAEHGKGKVVVIADDAPFIDKFIGEAENRKLAANVINWLKK